MVRLRICLFSSFITNKTCRKIPEDMEIILDMKAKHHTLYHTRIGRRRKLFHRSYTLYSYSHHQLLLIPNKINYYELHRICSFWKIYSPLFINVICGYISIFLCKINFGHIYQPQHGMQRLKHNRYK